MSPAILETAQCNWCTRQRPRFRVHRLASNQVICDYCLDWHYHALDFLGGAPPAGCQACETDYATLVNQAHGGAVRLYVVPKDGYLQLLCVECAKPYLPKQKQLYKGTQFGAETLKIL